MILWTYKLISSVRRAIAGRKYPHQLAWAVAFGVLLGVIPHGNLLAILVLLVVLSLKLNHAMAGLTAVATTFLATQLDPYSHQLGEFVLGHPEFRETAASAWQLPLVPWTDLNNSVVMGSFLIGIAALLPVFALTYPVFRLLAPSEQNDHPPSDSRRLGQKALPRSRSGMPADATAHQLVLIEQGHATVAPPHMPKERKTTQASTASSSEGADTVKFVEIDDPKSPPEQRVVVETRIDVIRMKDHCNVSAIHTSSDDDGDDSQPMDEALNYLLRQLRDSQQRKAA